jgi:Mlc titration factor MtfA (ptsG expression regulator)
MNILIVLIVLLTALFTLILGSYLIRFMLFEVFNLFSFIYLLILKKPFIKHFYIFKQKLPNQYQKLLLENNKYYSKLSEYDRKIFDHRVVKFIENKKFVGLQGQKITYEMKVILAGLAIKLTFGLRRYKLVLVKVIYVFPDIYLSKHSNKWHKGEFNPKMKYIALSWKHVLEGEQNKDDNLNLALHEFAHALILQATLYKHDYYLEYYFRKIDAIIKNPIIFQEFSTNKYFREYASVNRLEFYSVAIECFFETPKEFKNQLPNLYQYFSMILNNDVLKVYESNQIRVSKKNNKSEFGYIKEY